ncbi:MAG: hypothetical protein Q7U89_06425 [Coriobacteriia bacterium]|nr:hypothetical protein [Coriobacteriia bacterium]
MSTNWRRFTVASGNAIVAIAAFYLALGLPARFGNSELISKFQYRYETPGTAGLITAVVLGVVLAVLQSRWLDRRPEEVFALALALLPSAIVGIIALLRFVHVTPAVVADEGLFVYFSAMSTAVSTATMCGAAAAVLLMMAAINMRVGQPGKVGV